MMGKAALGQVFSEYIIIHHLPGLVQQASNGLSNSGLGSTPPQKGKKQDDE
jgi:hypothetical protein